MIVNIVISPAALCRYGERQNNAAAQSGVEQLINERFPDQRMERIYPNAIFKAGGE